jgi:hypothetical protein
MALSSPRLHAHRVLTDRSVGHHRSVPLIGIRPVRAAGPRHGRGYTRPASEVGPDRPSVPRRRPT